MIKELALEGEMEIQRGPERSSEKRLEVAASVKS